MTHHTSAPTPTSREQLARAAAYGLMPVLAEEIARRLGVESDTLRMAPVWLGLAQCERVVGEMPADELDRIAAVYAPRPQ